MTKVEGLERIEKLEALIANMSQIGNGDSTESLRHDSLELLAVSSRREASTQTLSTGDIVMTKIYEE